MNESADVRCAVADVTGALRAVASGRDLTEGEAFAMANAIMTQQVSDAQIAGLLMALRTKGESDREILGFARAMRNHAVPIPLKDNRVLDTCGTGGDGLGTFNVSTVVGFVAAGAGCKVAKHGNRSSSGRCGSAEVLGALGVETEMSPEQTARCIEEIGVGFLFAPQYHQATRHAARVRRELGVRTIFNILGPLTHPGGAAFQLMGVFDGSLTEVLAGVLRDLGSARCMVVHGRDGLDEITLTDASVISEWDGESIRTFDIRPEDFGLGRARMEDLCGGDAGTNAATARSVLSGRKGPARDVVLLNSAAAIYVCGQAGSMAAGLKLAAESIDSGAALDKLERLRAARTDGRE